MSDISRGNVLPVTTEIYKPDRVIVNHLKESLRATAMLNIREAVFTIRRHENAVHFANEALFDFGQPVDETLLFVPFIGITAAHSFLNSLDLIGESEL